MQSDCRAIDPLADYSKIHIIARALVGIAFEAQCLKVSQVVLAAVFSRNDMVHLNGSFICRNAAKFAAEPSALQDFITEASREVAQRGSAVVVDSRSAFLQIAADRSRRRAELVRSAVPRTAKTDQG